MSAFSLRIGAVFCLLATACSGLSSAESTAFPEQLAFVDDQSVLSIALERPSEGPVYEISLGDQNDVIVADLFYDGLTESQDGVLVPALAREWTSERDFTRWTFELDPERTDAASVIDSFERLRSDGATSQPALLLGHVLAIEASGPSTVVFTLDRPDAGLAWLLSGVRYSVVGSDGAPTSLYRMSEVGPGQTYLRHDSVIDVLVRWVNSPMESLDLLYAGEVEAALVPNADYREAAEVFDSPLVSRSVTRFYVANTKAGDLADAETRSAVLAEIDGSKAAESTPSLSSRDGGLVPEAIEAFTGGGCEPDCWTSRRGVAVDDSDEVIELVIGYVAVTQSPVAETIADDLIAIGYDARAVQHEPGGLAAGIESGEIDLYAYGLAAEAGSPDALIRASLHSESQFGLLGPGASPVDELIDMANETEADEDRWDLLAQAHRAALAQDFLVTIGTAHSSLIWANHEMDGMPLRPDGSIQIETVR